MILFYRDYNKKYSLDYKNNKNNLNERLRMKNNIENPNNIGDLLKGNKEGNNKSFHAHNNNININKQKLNKIKYINKIKEKYNYISKIETNDNLINIQKNYINKNVININNNNPNNPNIFDIQSISARTQQGNNIKGDKGSITQIRILSNSLNKQKMINNNNQNYLSQINNNISNNINNKYNEKNLIKAITFNPSF